MAEHPLLFFPKPVDQSPGRRGGGGSEVRTPSAAEQRARLDAKFRHIARSFADIQTTVQGMEPEQVIVLETLGASVDGLDEDDYASRYQPRQQQHGTAMASLIAYGDLGGNSEPIDTQIYVRPILVPFEDFNRNVIERTPDDRLLIDIIHQAVRRIKGTAAEPGVAPKVKVVNLSFGNSWQPFDRQMSPLAKLLDWLAWEYKLLFLVSAGNQSQSIELSLELPP